jgi:glycosyltransferase involved in cell wall biosynthesis
MLVQLGLTSRLVIEPLAMLERFLYARADRVIALTDGIADRIRAKGVPPEKITVIPNAMLRPTPLDTEARNDLRCRLGWDGKVVVVWAGSHNPMNGLDVVVDAARLLQDRADILVVFIGDGSLKNDLVVQASDLRNVEFHDPIPKTEIGAWLRAADIGLLHSRRFEVFTGARPNKLFDYMAAGLAIVSTVPGEAWRLVDEAGAGLAAEWEDPGALADAIRSLADRPELRRAMGAKAFAAVIETHSREATAARLATVLESVLDEHVRTGAPRRAAGRPGRYQGDLAPRSAEAGVPSATTSRSGARHDDAAD